MNLRNGKNINTNKSSSKELGAPNKIEKTNSSNAQDTVQNNVPATFCAISSDNSSVKINNECVSSVTNVVECGYTNSNNDSNMIITDEYNQVIYNDNSSVKNVVECGYTNSNNDSNIIITDEYNQVISNENSNVKNVIECDYTNSNVIEDHQAVSNNVSSVETNKCGKYDTKNDHLTASEVTNSESPMKQVNNNELLTNSRISVDCSTPSNDLGNKVQQLCKVFEKCVNKNSCETSNVIDSNASSFYHSFSYSTPVNSSKSNRDERETNIAQNLCNSFETTHFNNKNTCEPGNSNDSQNSSASLSTFCSNSKSSNTSNVNTQCNNNELVVFDNNNYENFKLIHALETLISTLQNLKLYRAKFESSLSLHNYSTLALITFLKSLIKTHSLADVQSNAISKNKTPTETKQKPNEFDEITKTSKNSTEVQTTTGTESIKSNANKIKKPNVSSVTNSDSVKSTLIVGDHNLTNLRTYDVSNHCKIRSAMTNTVDEVVRFIKKLPKQNNYVICFSNYCDINNEIKHIVSTIRRKNSSANIFVTINNNQFCTQTGHCTDYYNKLTEFQKYLFEFEHKVKFIFTKLYTSYSPFNRHQIIKIIKRLTLFLPEIDSKNSKKVNNAGKKLQQNFHEKSAAQLSDKNVLIHQQVSATSSNRVVSGISRARQLNDRYQNNSQIFPDTNAKSSINIQNKYDILTEHPDTDLSNTSQPVDKNSNDKSVTKPNKTTLPVASNWNSYQQTFKYNIVKTPTDGHCLIYAVVNSLDYQCKVPRIPQRKIVEEMHHEAAINFSEYENYYTAGKDDMYNDMCAYLNEKRFSNNFADIAPAILSKVTNTKIKIIDVKHSGVYEIIVDHTNAQQECHEITIHRQNDHYSALKNKQSV